MIGVALSEVNLGACRVSGIGSKQCYKRCLFAALGQSCEVESALRPVSGGEMGPEG